jgi:hypothetical protein
MENGCTLLGGETAEMPGLYPEGEYDLVGTIVGSVDADKIITGENPLDVQPTRWVREGILVPTKSDRFPGLTVTYGYQVDPEGISKTTSIQEKKKGDLEKFIQTIKYVNHNNITKDWKTYRNEKLGFEFQYPTKLGPPLDEREIDLSCYNVSKNKGAVLGGIDNFPVEIVCDDVVTNPDEHKGGDAQIIKVANKEAYLFDYVSATGYVNKDIYIPYDNNYFIGLHHSYKVGREEYVELSTEELEKILSTFKFFKVESNVEELYPEGKPIIKSVIPSAGSKGTQVIIDGEELAGFEGDLFVYFEREDGEVIRLGDDIHNYTEEPNKIEVTIDEPCEKGETIYHPQSGEASQCPYVEFTPGIYKVYVKPYVYKSNIKFFQLMP